MITPLDYIARSCVIVKQQHHVPNLQDIENVSKINLGSAESDYFCRKMMKNEISQTM